MSLYTNSNVVTHIIDPVYNRSQQRSIFNIPNDTHILANMRLGGFGAISSTATTYLGGLGSLGVIDSVILETQDGTVIDQLQNFQLYQAFKNYNKTNQHNKDTSSNLAKTNNGSYFGGLTNATEQGIKIRNYNINPGSRAVLTTELLTSLGWLRLAEVLNVLKVMPVINTTILKDLRLIINYNSTLGEYLTDTGNGPFETSQPYLILDELKTDEQMPLLTTEFNSIEHDVINIDGIFPTAGELTKVQNVNRALHGFRNKSIQRMMVCKEPTLPSSYQETPGVNTRFGKVASVACHKEVLQVSVNGMSLWTENGINKENQRLAMLNDVYDGFNTYPFLNGTAYLETDAVNRNMHYKEGNNDLSMNDYYGCLIQSEISDLKINFSRTGVYVATGATPAVDITNTASVNQALNMHFFAEVKKVLVPAGDNGFLVQYL